MQKSYAKKSLSILLSLLLLLGTMSGMTAFAARQTYSSGGQQQIYVTPLAAGDLLYAGEVLRFSRDDDGTYALRNTSTIYYGSSQYATVSGSNSNYSTSVKTWTVPCDSTVIRISWDTNLIGTKQSAQLYLAKTLTANNTNISLSPASPVYNGAAFDVSVSYGDTELVKGTDYTLAIQKDGAAATEVKAAGAYTLTVTGTGNYAGTVSASYTIAKATPVIGNYVLTAPEATYVYDGEAKTATVSVAQAYANYAGLENVSVAYFDANGDEVDSAKAVGAYTFKLNVEESDNINAAVFEDDAWAFEITVADPALEYVAKTHYYTGSAQELINSAKAVPEGTIHYSLGDAENELAGLPVATDIGSYTVCYRIEGTDNVNDLGYDATRQIVVDIIAVPTITMANYTYGETPTDPAVAGNAGEGDVTYYYAPAAAEGEPAWTEWSAETVLNVGDYYLYAEIAATDDYDATATAPVTFSVLNNEVSAENLSIDLAYDSVVYSGEDNEPAVTVYDGETEIPAEEYTVTYSANVEPGTATVTVTDNEGGNYTVSGTKTFTITKIEIAPALTMDGYTYAGELAQPALTDGSNPGEGTVTFYYAAAVAEGDPAWAEWTDAITSSSLNAGDYLMKAEVAESAHYLGGEAEEVGFTVAKADIEPTVAQDGWTYGDDATEPVVTGNTGEGDVVIMYYTDEDCTVLTTADDGAAVAGAIPANGGDYYVVATIAETANYNGAVSEPAAFTIAKKAPVFGEDFNIVALNSVYTGDFQALVEKSVAEGSDLTVTLSFEADGTNALAGIPRKAEIGEYNIYYSVTGNRNYEDVDWTGPIAAKILPVPQAEEDIVAPVAVEGLVYDGTAKALIEAGSVAEGKGTMQYAVAAADDEEAELVWGEDVPAATAAGDYNVYYKVVGEGIYADTEEAFVAVSIAAKEITVVADAKAKTYGEADPELTYVAEGLVEGDALNGALARAAGEDVGEYDITIGTLANPNYDIAFTGAALVIEAKALTVVADAKNKTYGEADPALTYTATGLVEGDALEGALARAAGEDVGEYDITIGTLANPNYDITFTGAKLTITANMTALDAAIAAAEAYYEEIKDAYPEIAEALKAQIDAVKDLAATEQQAAIEAAVASLNTALNTAKEQKAAAEDYANSFIGRLRSFFSRIVAAIRNLFEMIILYF